jgi:hypothetical protein
MSDNNEAIKRINNAIEFAIQYGGIDGAHHKMWTIDQIVRILAREKYNDLIREACEGEDGPDTYDWDVGIAP